MPFARGTSGPTIVRSTFVCCANSASASLLSTATGTQVASWAMPAFPGAQNNSSGAAEVFCNDQQSACSLPPDPTTKILICEAQGPPLGRQTMLLKSYKRSLKKMLDTAGS